MKNPHRLGTILKSLAYNADLLADLGLYKRSNDTLELIGRIGDDAGMELESQAQTIEKLQAEIVKLNEGA